MYAIKENKRIINDGTEITTFSRDIISTNLIQIEAGTNGFHGGDTDMGGRTYFRIENKGATDISVFTRNDRWGSTEELEVILGGDSELVTIIQALKFIVKVLEEQSLEISE